MKLWPTQEASRGRQDENLFGGFVEMGMDCCLTELVAMLVCLEIMLAGSSCDKEGRADFLQHQINLLLCL